MRRALSNQIYKLLSPLDWEGNLDMKYAVPPWVFGRQPYVCVFLTSSFFLFRSFQGIVFLRNFPKIYFSRHTFYGFQKHFRSLDRLSTLEGRPLICIRRRIYVRPIPQVLHVEREVVLWQIWNVPLGWRQISIRRYHPSEHCREFRISLSNSVTDSFLRFSAIWETP